MSLTPDSQSLMQRLDQRSRDIFKEIVEGYLTTGEPVGSRTLSKGVIALSPASIRNVMADLTDLGLLDAPHVSAGRAPTHRGLRLFVDGFLEIGEPSSADKREIEERLKLEAYVAALTKKFEQLHDKCEALETSRETVVRLHKEEAAACANAAGIILHLSHNPKT